MAKSLTTIVKLINIWIEVVDEIHAIFLLLYSVEELHGSRGSHELMGHGPPIFFHPF